MVREMGVMEKCTFCVQRLRAVKDSWRDSKETVPDSALDKLTACAAACPTDSITFGNAKTREGHFGEKWEDPRAYTLLNELNTKPGIRYLARIKHQVEESGHHADATHADPQHGEPVHHDGAMELGAPKPAGDAAHGEAQ
jgi:molybdopterin-containing oxidoreductase family iron-sulfur binding subunit